MLRPQAVDDSGFEVTEAKDGSFRVTGAKPERWVRQTSFSNDEAVGYLADRLAKLGVETALAKAGAVEGSLVRIGEVEFEWEPTDPATVAAASPRGSDSRLETDNRVSAAERLAARRARRAPGEDEAEENPS